MSGRLSAIGKEFAWKQCPGPVNCISYEETTGKRSLASMVFKRGSKKGQGLIANHTGDWQHRVFITKAAVY